jgi:hypothetical protein
MRKSTRSRGWRFAAVALAPLVLLGILLSSAPALANPDHSAGDYFVFAKAAGDGSTSDRKAFEPDCDSSNDKQADVSGSNSGFYGRIHSNADLAISGSNNVFSDTTSPNPELTYGVNDGPSPFCQLQADGGNTYGSGAPLNITGSGDPTSVHGPYQIGPKAWPGNLGDYLNLDGMTFGNVVTQVLPGEACDRGTLTGSSDLTITAADAGRVVCNGTGKITIGVSNLGSAADPFEITMISHGLIEVSGSNHYLAPAAHGVLAWTDQRFSTDATSFKLSGSNINVPSRAIAFTPRSGQDVSGSNNATLCLQLIGQGSIKIAGSNSTFGPYSPGCAVPEQHELTVSKTAHASFDRDWEWTIKKSVDEETSEQNPLTLALGQLYELDYEIEVGADATDSNFAVTGKITIENETPEDATITSIDDVVNGTDADVDCGEVEFPYELESGETLECDYEANGLTGAEEENTVEVTTSGDVAGGQAKEPIDWENGAIEETDECIDLSDTHPEFGEEFEDPLNVCADEDPFERKFEYSKDYEATECGTDTVENTASFTTNDTATQDSDTATVYVRVPCGDGCSLTPGYWKTHSKYGPAPYDDNWANVLPSGEDTTFFSSGKSYYDALWTSPKGNAYYILAHAYIAAELNFLNGADPTDAEVAFNAATALFQTYTPAQVAAAKGKNGNALRAQFISLAKTLDDYNNGLIGPGHCDEDQNSLLGTEPSVSTETTEPQEPSPVKPKPGKGKGA